MIATLGSTTELYLKAFVKYLDVLNENEILQRAESKVLIVTVNA